ncbi:DUF3310 domain-containing protein [Streptomyces solincola]|nr:DUF3310 domain-containing protein [Streptomyces solincola]
MEVTYACDHPGCEYDERVDSHLPTVRHDGGGIDPDCRGCQILLAHRHHTFVEPSPYADSFTALENGASPSDPSTAPKHYQGKAMQPWQIWEAYDLDPWSANVIKYVLRAGRKGPKVEDLRKARHYLDYLIEREQSR